MQVTVTVPATTANLGPGFDCLGLALALYNRITLVEIDGPVQVTVTGEGAGILPLDRNNLVVRAAERVFARVGYQPKGIHIQQHNAIPVGSGLGSSAAAVLAGMLAADAVAGSRLSLGAIVSLAAEMEGHPDNVAPAALGGLVLANKEGDALTLTPLEIPPLRVLVVLPAFTLSTEQARAALPEQVPLADAVSNMGRIVLLVHALQQGNPAELGLAMHDRLHQPYRLPLIPGAVQAIAAAGQAGAAGVALSGAGPGLIAFAHHDFERIQTAMQQAFLEAGLSSRAWLLDVDMAGAKVSHGQD